MTISLLLTVETLPGKENDRHLLTTPLLLENRARERHLPQMPSGPWLLLLAEGAGVTGEQRLDVFHPADPLWALTGARCRPTCTECWGLNRVPQEMLKSWPPVPANVTFSGNTGHYARSSEKRKCQVKTATLGGAAGAWAPARVGAGKEGFPNISGAPGPVSP